LNFAPARHFIAVRICVIFNPAARGDKARRWRALLEEIAAECALKKTTAPGMAQTLAAEAVRDGFDTIVAAGGDGTLNEVINGIGREGFATARLGVLPLGTVNVFARECGLPRELAAAWQIIRAGHETRIDLPAVEFTRNERPERRLFAQMAGAGIDARAIDLSSWELKKKIGALAYLVGAGKALREARVSISAVGAGRSEAGELVLVGNGRFYGGAFPFFPEADLRDGLLEVCVFPKLSGASLGRLAMALLFGRRFHELDARYFRTDAVTLTSSPPALFETEGDVAGHLPARFTVHPLGMRVLVPADS
jgi:diacylglycerol kinase (ATP)